MAIDQLPIKNPSFETDGNSPAFSVVDGMTKREYFAAAAMQGLLANPDLINNPEHYAAEAVKQADWLIKALNQ